MIPTYRKHSSGQARVVINGRCFYLGKYGSKASKRRYDALVAEWLASSRSSSFGLQRETLTLSHLMLDYLRHCKRHYVNGPNSEHAPTKQVLRKVRQLYADLPASEFGPAQFKAVRQLLIDSASGHKKRADDPRPRKKLSRPYINALMKRVARMFRWAAAEGLVSPDVYNALRLIPSLQRGRTTARETERVKPVDEGLVQSTDRHKALYERVSAVSREIKLLAQSLNVPILLLAQLNREGAKGMPTLEHLRDSGAIEQDADNVWFLHRDDRTAHECKLIIAKQRQGEIGTIDLEFDGTHMTFDEPIGHAWQPR